MCGWYTDPRGRCSCSVQQISKYLSKISGPLLDRFDIHLEVPALSSSDLLRNTSQQEDSMAIKGRTTKARKIQSNRFTKTNIYTNAKMSHQQIHQYCLLDDQCKSLLKQALEELNLSARAHDKILKLARTIADLAGEEQILDQHIAEAIQYRSLDRDWWG